MWKGIDKNHNIVYDQNLFDFSGKILSRIKYQKQINNVEVDISRSYRIYQNPQNVKNEKKLYVRLN